MKPVLFILPLLMLLAVTARPPVDPIQPVTPTNTASVVTATPTPASSPTPIPTPALLWDEAEQVMVAFICHDEMAGLGLAGLASCAAAIAKRQARPDRFWRGGGGLEDLLRPSQFAVRAARVRPWQYDQQPPEAALAAVRYFLAGEYRRTVPDLTLDDDGCWDFDSFQASTPYKAREWRDVDPEARCIVVNDGNGQASLFFDWGE